MANAAGIRKSTQQMVLLTLGTMKILHERKRQAVIQEVATIEKRVLNEMDTAWVRNAGDIVSDAAIKLLNPQGRIPKRLDPRISVDQNGNVRGIYEEFGKPGSKEITKEEFIGLIERLRKRAQTNIYSLDDSAESIIRRYFKDFTA